MKKLLKEFENHIEINKDYGMIQVIQADNDLLIVEQECKNEKEFRKFINWVQSKIIFNLKEDYNNLIGKEIDIISQNYRIATYTV